MSDLASVDKEADRVRAETDLGPSESVYKRL